MLRGSCGVLGAPELFILASRRKIFLALRLVQVLVYAVRSSPHVVDHQGQAIKACHDAGLACFMEAYALSTADALDACVGEEKRESQRDKHEQQQESWNLPHPGCHVLFYSPKEARPNSWYLLSFLFQRHGVDWV